MLGAPVLMSAHFDSGTQLATWTFDRTITYAGPGTRMQINAGGNAFFATDPPQSYPSPQSVRMQMSVGGTLPPGTDTARVLGGVVLNVEDSTPNAGSTVPLT